MAQRGNKSRHIALKDAALFYASRRLKEELRRVQNLPVEKNPPAVPSDTVEALRELGRATTAFLGDLSLRRAPIYEMEKGLVKKLQDRILEAWGLQIKPEFGSRLVKIPYFCIILHKVYFHKNSIEFEDRLFKSVEIRKPIKSGTPLAPKTKNKAGRKSIDSDLDKIVSSLISQAQLSGIQKKEMVSRVRDEAKREYPAQFPSQTQPSATKIRQALKRAGF